MFARRPSMGSCRRWAGVMSMTGAEGGAPARVGYRSATWARALVGLAVTSGLVRAARKAKGTRVQVSMLDCQLSLPDRAGAEFIWLPTRSPNRSAPVTPCSCRCMPIAAPTVAMSLSR